MTVFGRTMEVHEKQGNLQEWWIGTVESIPGTYVGRECLWRNGVVIPLRFLFNLTLIFQDSLDNSEQTNSIKQGKNNSIID
jgi:hypothetical protein